MKLTLLVLFAVFSLPAADAPGAEVRHGQFPMSALLHELVDDGTAQYFEGAVAPDEHIEWEVYVPESYDPQRPAGLMVFVSPIDTGNIPGRWKPVMDEHNLIWMAAHESGNQVDAGRRASFALLAPVLAGKTWAIDKSRVYLSGFSGGGRVASAVAPDFADVFTGAIYHCGVNFWGSRKPARIEAVRSNRYVFVTGTEDFNRRETRDAYRSYRRSGVENVLLMEIEGMGHDIPPADRLGEAISFLDNE